MTRNAVCAVLLFLGGYLLHPAPAAPRAGRAGDRVEQLGNFSVSLNVKDLATSRAFYEKLGFHAVSGDRKRWIVMENSTAVVGLFQGYIAKNALTFNPGWDRNRKTLTTFQDVREIQRVLEKQGVKLSTRAVESTTGPAYFSLEDPDGNPILIDQFVPAPKK